MSELMLDDKLAMDDANPFVEFMPGSSRQPHDFGEYVAPEEEKEEEPYKSPACDVVSKNVGRPGYSEEKCALSRPLIPGRNIDKGFTERGFFHKSENVEKIAKAVNAGATNNFIMNLISMLFLILLIVMF